MPVRIDSIRLTYGHVFEGGTFLVVNWYRRVYPTMSGTFHKQVGLGCIRKGTEQVAGGKLISRTLPGSLLQFLPSGSCFDFCPSFSWWWTLTCKPKKSSPSCFWLVFYHSSREADQSRGLCQEWSRFYDCSNHGFYRGDCRRSGTLYWESLALFPGQWAALWECGR